MSAVPDLERLSDYVFHYASEDPERVFSEYHLRIATIFGQHASVAILNARLVETLRSLRVPA
ncbi:MAG: hypothetical protein IH936_03465 [Acidobacteria bacterium]|nr:hypothetical protein [Acidobacteriota bacterium]